MRTFLSRVIGLLVIVGVVVGLGHQLASSSSPQKTSVSKSLARHQVGPDGLTQPGGGIPRAGGNQLGEADGAVPDGTTVFDEGVPAVANLDPELLDALRRAASDASRDGISFVVNSGWRSPEYQQHLLDDAVSEYGSTAEAARWVATPETSPHVSGEAADLGPSEAEAWLSGHGAAYGLCQIYGNEPWHYELRPEATDQGCPPMYADPTQDPRMR
jgi:hypothetical protein